MSNNSLIRNRKIEQAVRKYGLKNYYTPKDLRLYRFSQPPKTKKVCRFLTQDEEHALDTILNHTVTNMYDQGRINPLRY